MSIAFVSAGAGEIVSAGPMRVRILEDGGPPAPARSDRGDHSTARRRAAPHIHHGHEDTFYVISETPTFTCGTDTITAELGTWSPPRSAPHTRSATAATFP